VTAGNAFYWLVKILFWPFGRGWLGMTVRGSLPRRGALLLVANHVSLLDPAVLGSACPRPVRFLIKERLYNFRSQGWFYRGMRAIPVRVEGRADHFALRAALRALRAGEVLCIFPEGAGLDPAGGLRPPRSGAALIAAHSGVPIVPVGITGTHASLPKGRKWPRRGRIVVTFGEPFVLSREAAGREGRQLGAEEIMRRIEELLPPRGGS